MAGKLLSLDDIVTAETRDLLADLRRSRFTPAPRLVPPAMPRLMDRPELDVPLPYHTEARDLPDDPNLEDHAPRRQAETGPPPEHEGLERDYVFTLDGGRAADVPAQLGRSGPANQQDDSFDPADVPRPAAPVPPLAPLKVGDGRAWAADPEVFHGIAHEIYRGQVVFDHRGQEWVVFTYSVPGNHVTLQEPRLGYKAKTALNRFLGRELAACPFELGDVVAIPDPVAGGEREVTVTDINESAQCLWAEVDGKRRQVRFTKARLVRRPEKEEEERDETEPPNLS